MILLNWDKHFFKNSVTRKIVIFQDVALCLINIKPELLNLSIDVFTWNLVIKQNILFFKFKKKY